MRKIDVFTHILPEAYVSRMREVAPDCKDQGKRVRGVPMLVDLDVRFRVMDLFEGYQQILSIATPPVEAYASPPDAVDLARRANDGMAELVSRYPERFPGFIASLPLNDPDAAVHETDRAIRDLGARGIQLYSNVRGKPIVAPEFLPLFEAMAGHDLPIWLHPVPGLGLCGLFDRNPLAVRNLVDVRLALRDQRGDGAHRVRRASSIDFRTSRSSPITWARWRPTARVAWDPGGISWGRARRTRTCRWC